MKKIFALILAVAMVACMFAGCSKDNNKTDAKEILVIVKNSTAPFWISIMDGAKAAGAELGYTVTCKTPVDTAEGSGNEQQSNLCEEAIVSGVSCVVLAPVDSEAIVPATKKINEAGIPIVNLNTKISDDTQYKTFCGLENINQGYNTAKAMFELMNGEGKIFIIEGSTGAQTSIDRVKGFEKALAEYPNIEVVAQQSANYSRADALNVVQNLLQAHPDVVEAFTRAIYKGQQWVESHSAAEIAKVIQPQFAETDLDTLTTIVERYQKQDTWKTDPTVSPEGFVLIQKIMMEGKELSQEIPYDSIVVTEFAEKVMTGK